MQVETFEIAEAAEQHAECNDEARAIIERLGLTGQIAMMESAPLSGTVPYRPMTDAEFRVYREIAPEKHAVESFSATVIPLRVLQVLEHAKSLDFFHKFEVWAPESSVLRDPVLVAYRKDGANEVRYLLARWGSELDSFVTLCAQAATRWKARAAESCRKAATEAQREGERIAAMNDDEFLHCGRARYNWNGLASYTGVLE